MHYLYNRFVNYFWSIERKIVFCTLMVTLISIVVFSSVQTYFEYQSELNRAYKQVDIIQKSYVPTLTKSIWEISNNIKKTQLSGIKYLDYINYVNLIEFSDTHRSYNSALGSIKSDSETYILPLIWEGDRLGNLELQIDKGLIKNKMLQKYLWVLAFQFLLSLLIIAALYYIIKQTVLLRLSSVYRQIRHAVKQKGVFKKFELPRSAAIWGVAKRADELESIIYELNRLASEAQHSYEELKNFSANLECIVNDRTQQLRTTIDELERTQQRVVANEKLAIAGQLSAGIAHEIKNPLYIISGSIDLIDELVKENYNLLEPAIKNEVYFKYVVEARMHVRDLIDTIKEASISIDKTMTTMLSMTRGQSQTQDYVDINFLLEKVVKFTLNAFRHKNDTTFEVKYVLADALPSVPLYVDDFTRVLINMVDNALFALKEKSTQGLENYKPLLIVETKMIKDRVVITISDNGVGIPKEILAQIYDPFFTTKGQKGTGLGLSLSRDIIKKHEGSIAVNSINGEKTEFSIDLPLNKESTNKKSA